VLLQIEKLIYGGDGLARLASDEGRSKAVFIPFVLEGEQIEATLSEEKPGFARARAHNIIASSSRRTEPPCPYFFRCGGCQYQHTSYEHQLEIKAAIQLETLRRVAKIERSEQPIIHPSAPWNYRNRTRMKLNTDGDFAIGYYRFRSHDLLPVTECPISSPLINRVLTHIWELGRAGRIRGVNEIEFFADTDDSRLLIELYAADPRSPDVKRTAESMSKAITEVAGVYGFNHQRDLQQEDTPSGAGELLSGAPALDYRTASATYRVSGGSFFQTNRHMADELISIVCHGERGVLALDLYAGVGLFSLPLAKQFDKVVAAEVAPSSAADLHFNLPRNAKAVRATTEDYLQRSTPKQRPDLVVVDPPRGGLGKRVTDALARMSPPRITYVSCDPATLARDLSALLGVGYKIAELHLADLFPQTFHIESVVKLVR
jgi:23S rRNA (uracil1939-C5)-methyltransferase